MVCYAGNTHRTKVTEWSSAKWKSKKRVRLKWEKMEEYKFLLRAQRTQKPPRIYANNSKRGISKHRRKHPYQGMITLAKIGNNRLFKSKDYEIPVSVGVVLPYMCLMSCMFDNGACPKVLRAKSIVLSSLESICQRDLPEIWNLSNEKLTTSRTIAFCRQIDQSHPWVKFRIMCKFAVPVLLQVKFLDRVIRAILPTNWKFVPHHSSLVSILMIHEAKDVSLKNE